MSTEKHKEIVRRWVAEAWNRGNVSLADDLYAPGYAMHDPFAPQAAHGGVEGLKQFITGFRAGMPDLRFTIDAILGEGDTVAWRFTAEGTHTAPLLGIPATGRTGRTTGIVVSRFENGRWAEDWVNWDALGFLRQLGVLPA